MAKPALSYLSEEELKSIHYASLYILERIGVEFPEKSALDVFKDGGCKVDYDKMLVKIPPHLVDEAVRRAPKRFTMYARNPKNDIEVDRHQIIWGNIVGATHVIDWRKGHRRLGTNDDLVEIVKVIDALDNMHFTSAIVTPQDVPKAIAWQYAQATAFRNSSKHMYIAVEDLDCTRDIIKMAETICGGRQAFLDRPIISFCVLTVPPLKNDPAACRSILEGARNNIVIRISSGPIAGVTAPATLAGMIAQANAETLSWIALVQLANPGNPVFYGMNPRIMDMRYGTTSLSSPEWALMKACMADLGRFYDLPSFSYQMVIAAKTLDVQAGFEKTMTALMCALGRCNLIHGMLLNSQDTTSAPDFVINDEILGGILRVLRGFEVNEDTLALKVIEDMGPGGHFLRSEHTLKHYKKEYWFPSLLERRTWEEWVADGAMDMWQRACKRVEEILETHQVDPLPPEVSREIDEILESSERRIRR